MNNIVHDFYDLNTHANDRLVSDFINDMYWLRKIQINYVCFFFFFLISFSSKPNFIIKNKKIIVCSEKLGE